jgi:hypothetical protein
MKMNGGLFKRRLTTLAISFLFVASVFFGTPTTVVDAAASGSDLGNAVDYTKSSWSTGGDDSNGWSVDSNNYVWNFKSAMSGAINNNQKSWIQTTITGPGTIMFFWKVSSEKDCDYLKFIVDGSLKDKISGATWGDWTGWWSP